ncbi:MAG TPA: hypothetical protein VN761_04090 [Candidatus Polarisedimenticolia bacterium]|nr:hypothetical protein [Candidatus Polarisedimenticolia bacterium]
MEIEFNPSRVSPTGPSQPAARQDATAASTDGTLFQDTQALQEQLKGLQAVRPEKVDLGRTLVSNPQYPPDDVLDRIAVLLAIHVRNQ